MKKPDDEELAMAFLAGRFLQSTRGRLRVVHQLKLKPDEEREARRALARVLRNHDRELSVNMRYMLAILFEPTHPHETRQLVIRNRKAGDYAVDLEMARFVADKVDNENEKVIAAIKLAAECFGVSFSTAKRAWTKYGRWLK